MKILVDTHCWLWQLGDRQRLSPTALELLEDPAHEVFLSSASVWEIVIKAQLGKLRLPDPPERYVPERMTLLGNKSLPITNDHVLRVAALPVLHRDPFDRVLVAQALVEGMQLVTADPVVRQYGVPVIWAPR